MTSLNDIVNKLSSSKTKTRSDALQNLRSYIIYSRNGNSLNQEDALIIEKAIKRAFELEWQISANHGKRQISKASQEQKLQDISYLLRTCVESYILLFREPHILALLDIILRHTFTANGSICEVVCLNFSKALRLLLSHSPHLHHLRFSDWQSLVSYCCQAIEKLSIAEETYVSDSEEEPISQKNYQEISVWKSHDVIRVKQEVVELIYVMRSLVQWCAAPINFVSEQLLKFFEFFFYAYTEETDAHLPALQCLFQLCAYAIPNCNDYSASVVLLVFKILINSDKWKRLDLRLQLIQCLAISYPLWSNSETWDPHRSIRSFNLDLLNSSFFSLKNFLNFFGKRSSLSLANFRFHTIEPKNNIAKLYDPRLHLFFSLRHNSFFESYFVYFFLAKLILLKKTVLSLASTEQANKKQKTCSQIEELLLQAELANISVSSFSLQLMVIITAISDNLTNDDLLSIQKMSLNFTEKKNELQSWSFFMLFNICYNKAYSSMLTTSCKKEILAAASRGLLNSVTSPVCYQILTYFNMYRPLCFASIFPFIKQQFILFNDYSPMLSYEAIDYWKSLYILLNGNLFVGQSSFKSVFLKWLKWHLYHLFSKEGELPFFSFTDSSIIIFDLLMMIFYRPLSLSYITTEIRSPFERNLFHLKEAWSPVTLRFPYITDEICKQSTEGCYPFNSNHTIDCDSLQNVIKMLESSIDEISSASYDKDELNKETPSFEAVMIFSQISFLCGFLNCFIQKKGIHNVTPNNLVIFKNLFPEVLSFLKSNHSYDPILNCISTNLQFTISDEPKHLRYEIGSDLIRSTHFRDSNPLKTLVLYIMDMASKSVFIKPQEFDHDEYFSQEEEDIYRPENLIRNHQILGLMEGSLEQIRNTDLFILQKYIDYFSSHPHDSLINILHLYPIETFCFGMSAIGAYFLDVARTSEPVFYKCLEILAQKILMNYDYERDEVYLMIFIKIFQKCVHSKLQFTDATLKLIVKITKFIEKVFIETKFSSLSGRQTFLKFIFQLSPTSHVYSKFDYQKLISLTLKDSDVCVIYNFVDDLVIFLKKCDKTLIEGFVLPILSIKIEKSLYKGFCYLYLTLKVFLSISSNRSALLYQLLKLANSYETLTIFEPLLRKLHIQSANIKQLFRIYRLEIFWSFVSKDLSNTTNDFLEFPYKPIYFSFSDFLKENSDEIILVLILTKNITLAKLITSRMSVDFSEKYTQLSPVITTYTHLSEVENKKYSLRFNSIDEALDVELLNRSKAFLFCLEMLKEVKELGSTFKSISSTSFKVYSQLTIFANRVSFNNNTAIPFFSTKSVLWYCNRLFQELEGFSSIPSVIDLVLRRLAIQLHFATDEELQVTISFRLCAFLCFSDPFITSNYLVMIVLRIARQLLSIPCTQSLGLGIARFHLKKFKPTDFDYFFQLAEFCMDFLGFCYNTIGTKMEAIQDFYTWFDGYVTALLNFEYEGYGFLRCQINFVRSVMTTKNEWIEVSNKLFERGHFLKRIAMNNYLCLYFWQVLDACPRNVLHSLSLEIWKCYKAYDITEFPDSLKLFFSDIMGWSFFKSPEIADLNHYIPKTDPRLCDTKTYEESKLIIWKLICQKACSLLFKYDILLDSFIEDCIRMFFENGNHQELRKFLNFPKDSIIYDSDFKTLVSEEGSFQWVKLQPTNFDSLSNWTKEETLKLLNMMGKSSTTHALKLLSTYMVGFSTSIIQYIIHLILLEFDFNGNNKKQKEYVTQLILSGLLNKNTNSIRKTCMNILLYLRRQLGHHALNPFEANYWVPINYSVAASTAYDCHLYEQSLLFLTIHNTKTDELDITLLSDILSQLPCPDAYYGIKRETSFKNILLKAVHEKRSPLAISYLDAANMYRSNEDEGTKMMFSNTLNNAGFFSLNEFYIDSLKANDAIDECSNEVYASAWRMQKWDIPPLSLDNKTTKDCLVFEVLHAVHNYAIYGNYLHLEEYINKKLLLINPNEEPDSLLFYALAYDLKFLIRCNQSQFNCDILQLLKENKQMSSQLHECFQLLLEIRNVLLSLLQSHKQLDLSDDLASFRKYYISELLKISESFLIVDNLQNAFSVAMLSDALYRKFDLADENLKHDIDFLSSKILWQRDEKIDAIGMLSESLSKTNSSIFPSISYAYLGNWLYTTKSEKTELVSKNYFEKSLSHMSHLNAKEKAKIYCMFAQFCDNNYSSPDLTEDFKRMEKLYFEKKNDIQQLERSIVNASNMKEEKMLKNHHSREMSSFIIDEREYLRMSTFRSKMLTQSITHYLKCLSESDENDVLISRCCTMWLSNSHLDELNNSLQPYLQNLPCKKFIPVFYQLAARLMNENSKFQQSLTSICYNVGCNHPYHSLHVLFSLVSNVPEIENLDAGSRYRAVKKILDLLKVNQGLSNLVTKLLCSFENYVSLAEWNPRSKVDSTSFSRFPGYKWFLKDAANYGLPPITMNVKVNDTGDYSNIPTVSSFDDTIHFASGINAPKVITCLGSNGHTYKQLVKGGNDDLRQDAVMEQVFEQVNGFLRSYRKTSQRNLSMRTYKVIPLALKTGVIEWVQDTIPLGEYLDSAHKVYHPKEWSLSTCRKLIAEKQMEDLETRLKVYDLVCRHYRPVFRHFFLESYADPVQWFTTQTNYARSTAVASVLGHVLGLGDRHGQNILIDKTSGEVIHIDLGIAFEQGKKLPVPECVPFRLTRDVVDGMGITGVEGVFRRCMEFTLETLRREEDSLLSVLEVLRYDPLFSWLISPLRRMKKQKMQLENFNQPESGNITTDASRDPKIQRNNVSGESEAERAILKVRQKLSSTLSVEASVGELIRIAQDPSYLALMFCGWSAFQ
ncbi:Serine/threonine-protein kinase tel1 [Schizosaccharomyces pombe]